MKPKNIIHIFLIIHALIFSCNVELKAQTESDIPIFNGKKFNVFKIKIDNNSIKNFFIFENINFVPHNVFLDSIYADNYFLTTASIVDSNCQPPGLYINNRQLIKDVETADGNGNFFLKPNGAFLVTDSTVLVCQTSEIKNNNNIIFGIQSGPMLIINGKIHPAFNPNSSNKNIRSAVGKFKNNAGDEFILFAISCEEVTFFEMSQFLITQFNCSNALCIESVRCVMAIPFVQDSSNQSPFVECRYIIYNNQ